LFAASINFHTLHPSFLGIVDIIFVAEKRHITTVAYIILLFKQRHIIKIAYIIYVDKITA